MPIALYVKEFEVTKSEIMAAIRRADPTRFVVICLTRQPAVRYRADALSFPSATCSFYSARNARIASAVLATAIPSVCPSVRLSHAGIVSKRRHVARCSFHRWIAKCV